MATKDHASGGSNDRDQYKAMIEAAKNKEFECLLVWSLDRLTRTGTKTTLLLLSELNNLGVEVVSYQEQYINEAEEEEKELFISIQAYIARKERKRQSERVKAGIQRTMLTRDTWGKRPVIDSTQVLELHKQGLSSRKIAEQLNVSKTAVNNIINKFNT